MSIQFKTWNKNSFGLFDYECKDVQKRTLRLIGASNLGLLINLAKILRREVSKDSVEILAHAAPIEQEDSKFGMGHKEV